MTKTAIAKGSEKIAKMIHNKKVNIFEIPKCCLKNRRNNLNKVLKSPILFAII